MRVSTSFSREEVEILFKVFEILLRGGGPRDVAVLLRHPATGKLLQKIQSLRERSQLPSVASEAEEAADVIPS